MQTKLRDIPGRVYLRYGLLMIPATAALILVLMVVQHWVSIPIWLWITIISIWIAKEIIIFPFVWRAYDQSRSESAESMIGARGITRERLEPGGYILIQGELWKAEKMDTDPPIEKDRWVRVVNMQGLKLFVVSDSPDDG